MPAFGRKISQSLQFDSETFYRLIPKSRYEEASPSADGLTLAGPLNKALTRRWSTITLLLL